MRLLSNSADPFFSRGNTTGPWPHRELVIGVYQAVVSRTLVNFATASCPTYSSAVIFFSLWWASHSCPTLLLLPWGPLTPFPFFFFGFKSKLSFVWARQRSMVKFGKCAVLPTLVIGGSSPAVLLVGSTSLTLRSHRRRAKSSTSCVFERQSARTEEDTMPIRRQPLSRTLSSPFLKDLHATAAVNTTRAGFLENAGSTG